MLLSLGSSDLEMDNLPNKRRSDNLQPCGHPEHFWARWIGKENSNVMRVDHAQHAHHERRQTNKDPRRQSALCRAYPHIAINAKAVADHSGEPTPTLRAPTGPRSTCSVPWIKPFLRSPFLRTAPLSPIPVRFRRNCWPQPMWLGRLTRTLLFPTTRSKDWFLFLTP